MNYTTSSEFDNFYKRKESSVDDKFGSLLKEELFSLLFEAFEHGAKCGAEAMRKKSNG